MHRVREDAAVDLLEDLLDAEDRLLCLAKLEGISSNRRRNVEDQITRSGFNFPTRETGT